MNSRTRDIHPVPKNSESSKSGRTRSSEGSGSSGSQIISRVTGSKGKNIVRPNAVATAKVKGATSINLSSATVTGESDSVGRDKGSAAKSTAGTFLSGDVDGTKESSSASTPTSSSMTESDNPGTQASGSSQEDVGLRLCLQGANDSGSIVQDSPRAQANTFRLASASPSIQSALQGKFEVYEGYWGHSAEETLTAHESNSMEENAGLLATASSEHSPKTPPPTNFCEKALNQKHSPLLDLATSSSDGGDAVRQLQNEVVGKKCHYPPVEGEAATRLQLSRLGVLLRKGDVKMAAATVSAARKEVLRMAAISPDEALALDAGLAALSSVLALRMRQKVRNFLLAIFVTLGLLFASLFAGFPFDAADDGYGPLPT